MQSSSASVDVIPLFLENASNLQIDDGDLNISSPSMLEEEHNGTKPSVCIQHIPTGISFQSAGNKSLIDVLLILTNVFVSNMILLYF